MRAPQFPTVYIEAPLPGANAKFVITCRVCSCFTVATLLAVTLRPDPQIWKDRSCVIDHFPFNEGVGRTEVKV